MISSGNEAVVSFADYLYALARDEGTRIIAAYLEGVGNGPKLVRALAEAQHRGKPVVIIKSGASKTSARAAAAHTAALAGEDRRVRRDPAGVRRDPRLFDRGTARRHADARELRQEQDTDRSAASAS